MKTTYFVFESGHFFDLATEVMQKEKVNADEVDEVNRIITIEDIVEAEFFELRLLDNGVAYKRLQE